MITPLIQEFEWKTQLENLPLWHPPRVPTVVISPHPDDETLGCGGLIAALRGWGVEVSVVAVTDGENAYAGEVGLGEVREREQAAALERLGVDESQVIRLRITDSGVTEREAELEQGLRRVVREGVHVVAPWSGDFHPDHEVCGRVAERVTKACGASLSSYFFWTWHRGTLDTVAGLPLVTFPLSGETWAAKQEALARHASQLQHASGEPILPANLLGPSRRHYEVFLTL